MFTQLIPAGKKVSLKKPENWKEDIQSDFNSYDYIFTVSGTAALVYAINVLKKKHAKKNDVLLPAYTCPDVLSAVIAADANPVIVDIQDDRTKYNYDDLKNNISENTLAIIAIDLFGIQENYQLLNEIKEQHDIFIIRDSAQCFFDDMSCFQNSADAIVLSFGRGKPVTLLDGGMVLFDKKIQHVNNNQLNKVKHFISLKYVTKALIYNMLINRNMYWWVERIPFLQIGNTEYHEFNGEIITYSSSLKYLPVNMEAYNSVSNELQTLLIDMLAKLESRLITLPFDSDDLPKNIKLNRLPILVKDQDLRECIYKKLRKSGLGVSKMYPDALAKITNIPEQVKDREYKAAEKFASEILTLPVHESVNRQDVLSIISVISDCVKESLNN